MRPMTTAEIDEILREIDLELAESTTVPQEAPLMWEPARPADPLSAGSTASARPHRQLMIKILCNIVFYLFMLGTLFGVFLLVSTGGTPRNLFGYSYMTILTTSMQRDIPRGSLIITKQVPSETICAGDDITFFRGDKSTVTHRVIEVIENYGDTGERGFKTRGIENPAPDKDIVMAQNVVGVVRYKIPQLGAALAYIQGNVLLVAVIFVLLILFSACVKIFFSSAPAKKRKPARRARSSV